MIDDRERERERETRMGELVRRRRWRQLLELLSSAAAAATSLAPSDSREVPPSCVHTLYTSRYTLEKTYDCNYFLRGTLYVFYSIRWRANGSLIEKPYWKMP